jgi:hypothetical protein
MHAAVEAGGVEADAPAVEMGADFLVPDRPAAEVFLPRHLQERAVDPVRA